MQGFAASGQSKFSVFHEINDVISCSQEELIEPQRQQDCQSSSAAGCSIWDKSFNLSETPFLPPQ